MTEKLTERQRVLLISPHLPTDEHIIAGCVALRIIDRGEADRAALVKERDEARASHDALARVVGQALLVPSLQPGEAFAEPSDHAIVQMALAYHAEVARLTEALAAEEQETERLQNLVADERAAAEQKLAAAEQRLKSDEPFALGFADGWLQGQRDAPGTAAVKAAEQKLAAAVLEARLQGDARRKAEARFATATKLLKRRPKCVHGTTAGWERDLRAFLADQPAAPTQRYCEECENRADVITRLEDHIGEQKQRIAGLMSAQSVAEEWIAEQRQPAAPTSAVYEVWVGTENTKERIVLETTNIEEAARAACADLSGCTFWGMKSPTSAESELSQLRERVANVPRWSPQPAEPEEDDDGPLYQGFLTDPAGTWVRWEDVETLRGPK